jgi:hypothetical protein
VGLTSAIQSDDKIGKRIGEIIYGKVESEKREGIVGEREKRKRKIGREGRRKGRERGKKEIGGKRWRHTAHTPDIAHNTHTVRIPHRTLYVRTVPDGAPRVVLPQPFAEKRGERGEKRERREEDRREEREEKR